MDVPDFLHNSTLFKRYLLIYRMSPNPDQLPATNWHEVIGNPTIADAICDRIIHNAHRIELKGDSVRKIYTNN